MKSFATFAVQQISGASRIRFCLGSLVACTLVTTFVIGDPRFAYASESAPVIGSFNVGANLSGEIDERTGAFMTHIPLTTLAGARGGTVDIGVSYRQQLAVAGSDPHHIGQGFVWNIPFVDVENGVKVHPSSGRVFTADDKEPSGLAQYTLADTFFSQKPGEVPSDEWSNAVPYAYSLESIGGTTTYFSDSGNPIARINEFGIQTRWLWAEGHHLAEVRDGTGSRAMVEWPESGVRLITERGDGAKPQTLLSVEGGHLRAVTNPVGEQMSLGYEPTGLLNRMSTSSELGATTNVSYQDLLGVPAVQQVRVRETTTGVELTVRDWSVVGDGRLPSGQPTYSGPAQLWASGDGEYRYETALSDGYTRVTSQYNSLGSIVDRTITVSTPNGETVVQEDTFTYVGTENGGVPQQNVLPKQYNTPTKTETAFGGTGGNRRVVVEETVSDETGRAVMQRANDGTKTETTYDEVIPDGMHAPIGLLLTQKITGTDGTVSTTVNDLSAERNSITVSEKFTGSGNTLTRASRNERTTEADGFVSEERTVGTNPNSNGPTEIVTQFTRTITQNPDSLLAAGTTTVSQTDAAGTAAASTMTTVTDKTHGLEFTTTDPLGGHTTTSYDDADRVVNATDAAGRVTTTQYGDHVTRVSDAAGITRNQYVDALGRVIKTTDNITLVDGVASPQPAFERTTETRTYEQNASTIRTRDAYGLETVTFSDVFGRPVETIAPNGLRKLWEYDDATHTEHVGFVAGNGGLVEAQRITTTVKDDRNRVVKETATRADNVRVPEKTTQFDGLGRTTQQTSSDLASTMTLNPDGTAKTTTVTSTDKEMFDGEAVSAKREHTMSGVSTQKSLVDSTGRTHAGVSRVIDAAGRTTSQTDQSGGTTRFEYTPDGLVSLTTNERVGVTTRNTYDARTRTLTLAETFASDGTVSATGYEYDPFTGKTTAVFDPMDRENSLILRNYDAFGNVTTTTYPDGKKISHTFNEHGREISRTDIRGNITTYAYNAYGMMSGATQASPEGTTLGAVTYTYDPFGRMVELARANGVTTRYTFTSEDEIKTEITTTANTTISEASYVYDSHGNLTQRVDKRRTTIKTDTSAADSVAGTESTGQKNNTADTNSATPDSAAPTKAITTTYTYDAYNRLTESSICDGDSPTVEPHTRNEYEITVSGDITRHTTTSSQHLTATAAPDAQREKRTSAREFEYDQLGQTVAITTRDGETISERVTQAYDPAGNLTRAGNGTTYTYNVHNQPVTETRPDNTVIEHSYWATGQRKATTTTRTPSTNEAHTNSEDQPNEPQTSITGMYWDGTTLINDTHAAAANTPVTASYLLGTSRHARHLADTKTVDNIQPPTNYSITDRHGNVTALTDPAGTITTTYTYGDYGIAAEKRATTRITTPAERNPFQYANEYTSDTGTQLLNTRTYDPATMRFTTKDTAELHNLYAYANINPITLIDPTGQTPQHDKGYAWHKTAIAVLFSIASVVSENMMTAGGILSTYSGIGALVFLTVNLTLTATLLVNAYSTEKFLNTSTTETLASIINVIAIFSTIYSLGREPLSGFSRSGAGGRVAPAQRIVARTGDEPENLPVTFRGLDTTRYRGVGTNFAAGEAVILTASIAGAAAIGATAFAQSSGRESPDTASGLGSANPGSAGLGKTLNPDVAGIDNSPMESTTGETGEMPSPATSLVSPRHAKNEQAAVVAPLTDVLFARF